MILAPWHINYILWLLRVLGITQIGFTSKNQIGTFIYFIILYYDTHKNKQFKCYFICLLSLKCYCNENRKQPHRSLCWKFPHYIDPSIINILNSPPIFQKSISPLFTFNKFFNVYVAYNCVVRNVYIIPVLKIIKIKIRIKT